VAQRQLPAQQREADGRPAGRPLEPDLFATPREIVRDEELLEDLVESHREGEPSPAMVAADAAARDAGFIVVTPDEKPPSILRRFLTVHRHLIGFIYGAAIAVSRDREQFAFVRGLPLALIRLAAFLVRPFVRRDLRDLPLQVQLRRRLELLGPTYIKLGQVLALREDLLPRFITSELKNLLDKLPVMPFPMFLDRVARGIGRPVDECFSWVDPAPLGSASIGQIHAARTIDGDDVILKVVKPNIYAILKRDSRLLGAAGRILQVFFARYQPRRILDEFTEYTLREVDLRREADNAEQFALNFADEPDIVFPKIYREYSSRMVLTMERFVGLRPDSPAVQALPLEVRERVVDLGAKAIIRMLYQDGFFHADLHPGNLFVLDAVPAEEGARAHPRAAFIDLGMVGFFDGDLRRTLMYYYFSLVTGDAEGAARYLTSIAMSGPKADAHGFKRAVAEQCRRFYRAAKYGDISLAQLIMESVGLGGHYRMYFPVEMVLMTKALVTFEGVGQVLLPGFDVAKVSQRHISRLFRHQFNPVSIFKESFKNAPELVDLLIKSPSLAAEGLRVMEHRMRAPTSNPFVPIRYALISGSALIAGTVAASIGGGWYLWGPLFLLALITGLKRS
jgi:ubiquinone biosynthesis protein